MTANIDMRVLGVAHEAVAPPFQFPVHFIQKYIGQQRGEQVPYTEGNLARLVWEGRGCEVPPIPIECVAG